MRLENVFATVAEVFYDCRDSVRRMGWHIRRFMRGWSRMRFSRSPGSRREPDARRFAANTGVVSDYGFDVAAGHTDCDSHPAADDDDGSAWDCGRSG
jgi:hypothetical protein